MTFILQFIFKLVIKYIYNNEGDKVIVIKNRTKIKKQLRSIHEKQRLLVT